MWSVLRGQALFAASFNQLKNLSSSSSSSSSILSRHFSSPAALNTNTELLSLAEVQKILNDVGADDVKVIPAPSRCEFTDYMVIATGRSPWHVRNISQALIYKAGSIELHYDKNVIMYDMIFDENVKQKQKGVKRMLLPTVVGQEGGKWIVIDSGTLIIHAVDENARAYYNLEGLWTNTSNLEHPQDLEKAFVKIRPKNNSKKPSQARA
ncbi:hypothetical protein RD792_008749 [Penstemon davidsonii]|uniref:Uncharacterized protein n=1 Tax=Penstemon davidsonii TaxID=160366 RepID=A0ABR0DAV6_9LAMI|nr:hypothetical protein RD792_008749 [Penstemon davidsonii]